MRLLLGTLLSITLSWIPCALALENEYRASSYVFGTVVEVTALDEDLGRAQRAIARVFREFDRMHRELHAWQPGPLAALNEAIARGEKDIETTAEIAALIEDARRLSERSGDLFNPAIGKLVSLWSFHRERPGGPLPDSAEIARIVHAQPRMEDLAVNGNRVSSANREVRLDFGGYAKGYALDQAARILRDEGVSSALVNVGGNILALGTHGGEPWRIGLERPRPAAGSADLLGTIELADGEAIGTSGDYRRFYVVDGKRYSHIIDPRSGYPSAGVRSVTVVAPPGADAGAISDGASKPLFIAGVAGWRQAAQRLGISQALLVDDEGRVHTTPEMEKRLQRKEGTSARRALP